MSKATFDSTLPVSGANFSSYNMRNNYQSLSQGDSEPLRPRAQASPDMTVAVAGTQVEGYFHRVYNDYSEPLEFSAQNSPTVVAPISNTRIDILVVSGTTASGTLHWVTGAESASPSLPSIPEEMLPVCAVYCKTSMDRVLNYEERATDTTEGYLYRDLRPKVFPILKRELWEEDGGDVELKTADDIDMQSKKLKNLVAGADAADSIRYDQALKSGDSAGGDLTGTYPDPTIDLTVHPILSQHVASDTAYFTLAGVLIYDAAYTKQVGVRFLMGGIIRVTFTLSHSTTDQTAYARIYVNGVATGTERSHTGPLTPETFSEDITIDAGDTIEIYGKDTGGNYGILANLIFGSTLTYVPGTGVDLIVFGGDNTTSNISVPAERLRTGIIKIQEFNDTISIWVESSWRVLLDYGV